MNNNGFTIIELICILAIMGIIITLAIPSMNLSYEMKLYAVQLCSDIRYVRVKKMTEGKDYKIYIDDNFYEMRKGIKTIKRVDLPKDIKIISNYRKECIYFTYRGAPVMSGSINIFDQKEKRYYQITIVPASGRILLKDEIFE
ncbi:MAG: type II secretion system protein [Firmicutes bacterium]|nr:type II secretion system protein [Bacillota bacterium]